MAEIYKLTHPDTQKSLIGVATRGLDVAYKYWMQNCTKSRYENYLFYQDAKKYDKKKFEISLLETVSSTAIAKEMADNFIDSLGTLEPNGYNAGYLGRKKFKKPEDLEKPISKEAPIITIDSDVSKKDETELAKEITNKYGIDGLVRPKLKSSLTDKKMIERIKKISRRH